MTQDVKEYRLDRSIAKESSEEKPKRVELLHAELNMEYDKNKEHFRRFIEWVITNVQEGEI